MEGLQMEHKPVGQEKKGSLRGWIIVLAMAILFVVWGLFIYFAVGDKGTPPWNFGVVSDIPGESPYSTERYSK
jgi:hypothetical protein